MKLLKHNFLKIILYITAFLFGIITYSTIFDVYYGESEKLFVPLIIIGIIIYISLLCIIYKKIQKISDKTIDKISIVLSIVMFIGMIVWGLRYQVLPTYDLSHIYAKILEMVNYNTSFTAGRYFSIYPAQIPTTIMLYYICKFGMHFINNVNNILIIYNCIMISISAYLLYRIVKIKSNSKLGLIALLLMVLYPDFYLYASYYYTDILCIPFCIIGYYLLLISEKNNSIKNIIYFIISLVFFYLAYKIRVTSLILLIGYIVSSFLINKKMNYKKVIVFLITMAMLTVTSKFAMVNYDKTVDNNKTLPVTHWVMMGSNEENDGIYTDESVRNTLSEKNKVKYNIGEIKDNLKQISSKFLYDKLRVVWSNGNHDILRKYINVNRIDSTYEYLVRKKSIFLRYCQQIMKSTIYLLFFTTLILLIKNIKKSDYKTCDIAISIFGAIIFYLLWEVLSRYSFTFLPWIIIGSVTSLENYYNIIYTQEENKKRIKKVIGILVIVLTIIMLISNYYIYAVRKQSYNRIYVSQYKTNHYVPIEDNTIKEEFAISKSFNKIELSFKNNGDEITNYMFELYNSDGKLIYKKKFNSKWASSNDMKTFNIKPQKLNKKKKYYFLIYSLDSTKENSLSIGMYGLSNTAVESLDTYIIDVNANGKTYINNEKVDDSLRYKVMNYSEKSYMSKKIYIVFAIFILCIEYFTIYKVLIKENNE